MKEELLKYIKNFTTMNENKLMDIVDQVPIKSFDKGTILIKQGELIKTFYFVLKGCVRKYFYNEDGNEVSVDFYTEEQMILLSKTISQEEPSKYSLSCVEDCVLVVGDEATEKKMYRIYPELESMNMAILGYSHEQTQDHIASFISSTPEERYLQLIKDRKDLIERVPQHQLASYLGITPESLSRIKKRLSSMNPKDQV